MGIKIEGCLNDYEEVTAAGRIIEAVGVLATSPFEDIRSAAQLCNSVPFIAGSPTSPNFLTQPDFVPDEGYKDILFMNNRAYRMGLPEYYWPYDPEISLLETADRWWPVDTRSISPVVRVSIPKVLTSTPTDIQADLVRTYAILAQFPGRGYERRFRQVYGEALDVQSTWLDGMKVGKVLADPRAGQTARNKIMLDLIGPRYSLVDTGFKDWQEGIDLWLEATQSNGEQAAKQGPQFKRFPLAGQLCGEFIRDIVKKYGEGEITYIRLSLVGIRDNVSNYLVLRYARVPFVMKRVDKVPELKQLLQQRGRKAQAMGILLVLDHILDYIRCVEEERSVDGRRTESILQHLWKRARTPDSVDVQPLESYLLRGQLYYD